MKCQKPLSFLYKSSSLKAKGITVKASLSLSFIGLWMVLSNMCSAQPTLSISKTNGSPIIKWSAYSGGIYDLRRSPDMEVWTSETIVATNSQVSIQGTTTGHLFYEVGRVASPNGGFLNLKSGQVLSNTVTLQISGFTTDSSLFFFSLLALS